MTRTPTNELTIRAATIPDVPLIRQFICELAAYENLSHEVVVDEDVLRAHLFGPRPSAEAVLGFAGEEPAAFATVLPDWRVCRVTGDALKQLGK